MTIARRLAGLLPALAAATAAAAGTLTPIAPYADADPSATTSLLGINDAGWTTGSIDYGDGSARGFVRDLSGVYTVFGAAGAFTQGRAIGNDNTAVGYSVPVGGGTLDFRGFTRAADGTITLLYHPVDASPQSGVPLAGIAQGINDAGTIVGNYRAHTDPGETGPVRNHGYILTSGGGFTELTDPAIATASVNARGIANDGTVVGWQLDTTYGERAWIDAGAALDYFTHPGDLDASGLHTTVFEAINNHGEILGGYTDVASGAFKSFTFDAATDGFTDVVVPGATSVQTFGVNDLGQYVVSSDAGQFIYSPDGPSAPDGAAVFQPVSGGALPPGEAQFAITVAPGTTYYVDPAYAHGFEYLSGTGPSFASVTAPAGVGVGNRLALYLWNGSAYVYARTLTGGVAFDFARPVDRFELRGIPASAMIDPANPTSFVTGLTFAGSGRFDGFQNAIAGVPEPATWSLLVAGFGVAGIAVRRARRTAVAA